MITYKQVTETKVYLHGEFIGVIKRVDLDEIGVAYFPGLQIKDHGEIFNTVSEVKASLGK